MIINLEKRSIRLFIYGKRRMFHRLEKLFNCDFFNGFCLIAFLFWFFDLLLFYRMDMRRKIIRIRIPKPVKEVIEGADTGSITKLESAEDCIEWIYLQLSSPIGKEMDFKINGKKIRTLHTGRSPWFWTKDRVFAAEQFIGIRKIEIPKTFDDVPC